MYNEINNYKIKPGTIDLGVPSSSPHWSLKKLVGIE